MEIFGYVIGGDFYKIDSPSLSEEMKKKSTPVVRLLDMEKLKELLEKLAKTEQEVENVYDSCGGNFDDAYSIGITNGEAWLAKRMLTEYFTDTSMENIKL